MKLQNNNCDMENDIDESQVGNDVHPLDPNSSSHTNPESSLLDSSNDDDLPTSLIVTNLDVMVFNDENERLAFEEIFQVFEEDATFQYFKSFRRARVNFSSSSVAARARIQAHQTRVCDKLINCYFAQPITSKENTNHPYLQLPAPVKQFLISPPASPPVGWEPVDEAEPVINYDLLAAIAKLAPGEAHELHPPSETQPAIVVHICEELEAVAAPVAPASGGPPKPKIIHTRCPERDT